MGHNAFCRKPCHATLGRAASPSDVCTRMYACAPSFEHAHAFVHAHTRVHAHALGHARTFAHAHSRMHVRAHVKRSTLFLTDRHIVSVGKGGAAPHLDHPGAVAFPSAPIRRFNTW